MTGGASKALKSASQPWIRVLATIVAAEFSWVAMTAGTDRLHVNFMYVLADETGEISLPKDVNRREIAMGALTLQNIRQRVLSDAATMMEKDACLSAGWYDQLAQPQKAMEARALQANFTRVSTSSSAGLTQPRSKAGKASMFEIDAIVEAETRMRQRGFWVRWAGYAPDWEAWRVEGRGEEGDPLVTWEPESHVKSTFAYQEWLQGQQELEAQQNANGAGGTRA